MNLDTLYDLYGGICALCGGSVKRTEATRDHIIPRSLGGKSKGNLQLAHKRCNELRGSAPLLGAQQPAQPMTRFGPCELCLRFDAVRPIRGGYQCRYCGGGKLRARR